MTRRVSNIRIRSKEELAEKAPDIEVTIPVKKSREARYKLNRGSFFENRFWGRRLNGVAINEDMQIVYILEFNRSTDRDKGFLEVKKAHATFALFFISLKAAAPKRKFGQINFVVSNCGLVVQC